MTVPPHDERLLARWSEAVEPLQPVGRGAPAAVAGRDLLARWAEPHRRYHDLRHLAEVLAALDVLAAPAPPATVLAAYWHDAVYDPAATDNEQRSALQAASALGRLGAPAEVAAEVARLVRATADHVVDPDDTAAALLCDADLWVLAAPPERYAEYVRDVREEYAPCRTRPSPRAAAAVLRALVDRPRLYVTDRAHRAGSSRPRDNVRARAGAARRPFRRRPAPTSRLSSSRAGDLHGAERDRPLEQPGRDVVVVALEGPARHAEPVGEVVQLVVGRRRSPGATSAPRGTATLPGPPAPSCRPP